jgi:hypothetical protein
MKTADAPELHPKYELSDSMSEYTLAISNPEDIND